MRYLFQFIMGAIVGLLTFGALVFKLDEITVRDQGAALMTILFAIGMAGLAAWFYGYQRREHIHDRDVAEYVFLAAFVVFTFYLTDWAVGSLEDSGQQSAAYWLAMFNLLATFGGLPVYRYVIQNYW